MQPEIIVLGSLNIDLVVQAPRRPRGGETVTGTGFSVVPGGKGANQAVGLGRLRKKAAMAGRVGEDTFAPLLVANLRAAGVDCSLVQTTPGVPTGTALIVVDDAGENSIVVVPGANGRVSVADVAALEHLLASAKILMMQLEIPLETVEYAACLARRHGVTVMLDPAPARPLPASLLENVDIITPNETEASALVGVPVDGLEEGKHCARSLLERGVGAAVVKLAAQGAVAACRDGVFHVPGFPVRAVDTTATGDAFSAGLAVARLEGHPLLEAIRFANACGALAATRLGAQTSLPDRAEVDAFLQGELGGRSS
ncbi:MAG: ribokinase [Bacillota bacterium]